MKKIVLLSAFSFALSAYSQITINRSHVVETGYGVNYASDTNSYPIPDLGPNKTWDFTGLKKVDSYVMSFGHNSWFPGYQNFPGATHGFIDNPSDSFYQFVEITESKLKLLGNTEIYMGEMESNNFNMTLLNFPVQYGNTWSDVSTETTPPDYMGYDVDGSGPLPALDSVRFLVTQNMNSKVEGWGTCKTPLGNFNSLVVKTVATFSFKPQMKLGKNWITIPKGILDSLPDFVPSGDTSNQLMWWTNDKTVGFPLIIAQYSPGDDEFSYPDWIYAKVDVNSVKNTRAIALNMYPNPVHDVLTVTMGNYSGTIKVMDAQGRVVLEQEGTGNAQVSVKSLTPGNYFVSVIADGIPARRMKIIKY